MSRIDEIDGMTMSTLETFDVVVPDEDEYNLDALEILDNEPMRPHNTSWDFPSFNNASNWMENMDMVDEMGDMSNFDECLLYRGRTFTSKTAVIYACQCYSIKNNVEFYTKKSDGDRLVLVCRAANDNEGGEQCGWYVRAIRRKNMSTWEITQINDKHTCEKDIIPTDNPHFNKLYIAMEVSELIKEKLRFAPRQIKQLMLNKYGYTITYVKAWKSRQKALEILFGDWVESFAQLPAFLNAVVVSNPGSYVNWQTTPIEHGKSSVDRVFWAFAPAIEAFKHCRPILCVDGTHLYGKYQGVLLIAVGIDGNGHLLPLAYALVERENNDSWSWFMGCIRYGVTQRMELCVISDRHVGIMNVMKESAWVPPYAYHRVCSRHLASNFNNKVRNKHLRDLLKRTAYQNQKRKFSRLFSELMNALKDDIQPRQWLQELHPELWALAYDEGGRRWGAMTTNASECFNNVLSGGRDLPITALVNYTFKQNNDYFTRRRDMYQDNSSIYVPRIFKKLRALRTKSTGHEVETYDREKMIARITTGGKRKMHEVNIEKKTCTCGKWQLFHFPCSHLLALCQREHLSYRQFVAEEYFMEAYRNTWDPKFNVIPNQEEWAPYEGDFYVPNAHFRRTKRGRPPTRRRMNEMDGRYSQTQEGSSAGQQASTSRPKQTRKCSKCGELGHNRKTCDQIN